MNKIKKTFFILMSFIFVFASIIFTPINNTQIGSVFAADYNNTYTYDGSIDSDLNGMGNYSINSVNSLYIDGSLIFYATIDSSKFTSDYVVLAKWQLNSGYFSDSNFGNNIVSFYSHVFNNNANLSFAVVSNNSNSSKMEVFVKSNVCSLLIYKNSGTYQLIFSQMFINFKKWNNWYFGHYASRSDSTSSLSDYLLNRNSYTYDISSVSSGMVDMSSETFITPNLKIDNNFTYVNNLNIDPNVWQSTFLRYVLDIFNNGNNLGLNFVNSGLDKKFYGEVGWYKRDSIDKVNYISNVAISGLTFFNFTGAINSNSFSAGNILIYSVSFYFLIEKPVYRVNNTLIIYNYDYFDQLSKIKSIKYSLSKDNNLYVVQYSGEIPNSKYIYLYNNEIQNITFDEYIYLYLTFDGNIFYTSYSNLGSNKRSYYIDLDLGFDFNFTYYAEPLVLGNGSYNYTFEKPAYKDARIGFSIAPPRLEIPIEAWAYNVVIFFCFYCPIISDVLNLLHINYFINALMTVFGLFASSTIGNFVNAALCFLLFWAIMKSLLPSMGNSFVSGVKDTYGAIKEISAYKNEGKNNVRSRELKAKNQQRVQKQEIQYITKRLNKKKKSRK